MFFNLSDPITILTLVLALAITLSIHEAAHAAVANALGDPTARLAGRLTLNPLAHLDPIGTLLLFMAGFGWGKPVPVNPTHFQKPVRDETLIALAGPASNIIAAIIFGLVFRLFIEDLSRPLFQLMTILVFYNISLAIFNLIPIPPLDGSKILRLFLPYQTYLSLEQFSLPFLIFLVIAIRFNIPPINFLLFDSTKYFFQLFSGINIPL